MVKVGILDADLPISGEIIRLLINHPETEIVSLVAPTLMGLNISTKHHGLIGEIPLNFNERINLEEIDFLVLPKDSILSQSIISKSDTLEDLKLVCIGKDLCKNIKMPEFHTGLSEINRKTLVRGATLAYIPDPIIVPALIALAPLANYLLLNSNIEIAVNSPEDLVDENVIPYLLEELQDQLKMRQASFNGKIQLNVDNKASERQMSTTITIKNALPIEEIEKIYDQIYDDHNFTFLSRTNVHPKEVEGTQKVIINIEKPDAETLTLNIVSDPRMRGGAGDVVHVMNLFFGLHEKTGLTLKASRY